MRNLYSLFLSQAYQDCWDDYNRLLLKHSPISRSWDYVDFDGVQSAAGGGIFVKQIAERSEFLPAGTKVCRPCRTVDGKRVGSGGATRGGNRNIFMNRKEIFRIFGYW